jgi:hypothetical protein
MNSDGDFFDVRMRRRDRLAALAKAVDVQLDRFADELHRFISRFRNGNAAGKVGNVCANRGIALFEG